MATALASKLASAGFSLLPSRVRDAAAAAGDAATSALVAATDSDYVPDVAVRAGIRALLAGRDAEAHVDVETAAARTQAFIDDILAGPVAIQQAAANEQHYEVPTDYFTTVLGPRLKYSCALYESASTPLADAENAMLALTAARAGLADGQDVLELGCGWGSLCLYIAQTYPASRVTAVSNSRTQKAHIDGVAKAQGLTNLTVITADAATYVPPAGAFDRVVSVEMFEHMKNYRTLMSRIAAALRPGGRLFVHVFVHATMPYHFEASGPADWMARHFFTGGTMPSADLLPRCAPAGLQLKAQYAVNGTHYSRTLEAWLKKHDAAGDAVKKIMQATYGAAARAWNQRWRIFYMACSELFAYNGGNTWYVAHYVWEKV